MGRRRKKSQGLTLGNVFTRQNIDRVSKSLNNPVAGMLTAFGLTLLGNALGASETMGQVAARLGPIAKKAGSRRLQPKPVDCGPGVEYIPPPRSRA